MYIICLNITVSMPKTPYNSMAFWEQKYKTTCCQHYEWHHEADGQIIELLLSNMNKDSNIKVLQIGCGSSHLNEHLGTGLQKRLPSTEGCEFTCIDFSKQIIKHRVKNRGKSIPMHYLSLDVRSMKAFGDNSYDFIVDKGTLDCLFCEEQFIKEVLKALMECWRVLKGGAKMVVLSHGAPKFRMYLFRNKLVLQQRKDASGKIKTLHAYTLTKPSSSSEQKILHQQHMQPVSQQNSQGQQENKDEQEQKKQGSEDGHHDDENDI